MDERECFTCGGEGVVIDEDGNTWTCDDCEGTGLFSGDDE